MLILLYFLNFITEWFYLYVFLYHSLAWLIFLCFSPCFLFASLQIVLRQSCFFFNYSSYHFRRMASVHGLRTLITFTISEFTPQTHTHTRKLYTNRTLSVRCYFTSTVQHTTVRTIVFHLTHTNTHYQHLTIRCCGDGKPFTGLLFKAPSDQRKRYTIFQLNNSSGAVLGYPKMRKYTLCACLLFLTRHWDRVIKRLYCSALV